MARNHKIIIVVLIALVLVCACSTAALYGLLQVSRNVSIVGDPEGAAAVAQQIAEYEAPPGYEEAFAIKILDMAMVGLQSDQVGHVIMLMQFPSNTGMTRGEMELQYQQALQRQMGVSGLKFEPVGHSEATIRGQEVNLLVSEGANENGYRFRQVTGVFEGRNGQVLLAVIGPISTWEQAEIDAFISSIR